MNVVIQFCMICTRMMKFFSLFIICKANNISGSIRNKAFESRNADPTRLLEDLERLLNILSNKLTPNKIDIFSVNISEHIIPHPYLGYEFENKIK